MADSSALPTTATLWIGGELSWIEHGCLKSFGAVGQPIVLYSYDKVGNVPDNVECRDAREIWTPSTEVFENTAPSYVADLFRIHLMQQTDQIWVDTDVILRKPLVPDSDGFLTGFTPWYGEVNNCILRLPIGSASLEELNRTISDQTIIPRWIRPALQQRLARLPIEEREVARYHTLRTILGPKALTNIMKTNGEVSHSAEPQVLSPVPWQYLDVLFNPFGGWEGWFSEETRAVHLWSNMLRQHRKLPVSENSFIGQTFKSLGAPVP